MDGYAWNIQKYDWIGTDRDGYIIVPPVAVAVGFLETTNHNPRRRRRRRPPGNRNDNTRLRRRRRSPGNKNKNALCKTDIETHVFSKTEILKRKVRRPFAKLMS